MDKQIEENILSLESSIDRLLVLANTIESSGGMCKSFAMEALEVLPSFNNNLPKAYYTEKSSIAQYEVSLESIISGVWAFILKIITAIKNYIVKFIDWLFPSKKSANAPDVESLKETLEKMEKEHLDKFDKLFSDLIKKHNSHSNDDIPTMEDGVINFSNYRVIRDADEIVSSYITGPGSNSHLAYLLNDRSPHFHDIMDKGPYYNSFKEVKESVLQINSYLKIAKEDVDILNHSVTGDTGKISTISQYIIKGQTIDGKSDFTYDETAKYVSDKRVEANSKQHKKVITFSKLNSVFTESIKSLQFSDTLDVVCKIKTYINLLGDRLTDLTSKVTNAKKDDTELPTMISDGLKIVRSDLFGCLKLVSELGYYANFLANMHKRLIEANKELLKVIKEEIIKIYGTMPDDVESIYASASALFRLAA